MPSPIAHITMGYTIYRIFRPNSSSSDGNKDGLVPPLLLATTGLSLLPDLDIIPGILLSELNQYHNNLTHSLSFGLVAALGVSGVIWLKQRSGFARWFSIALLCLELHVIMDFFTIGRGVMLLWPFFPDRYEPAIKLFYGLHRSDGLLSIRHIWTLISELGFTGIVMLLLSLGRTSKGTRQLRRYSDENENRGAIPQASRPAALFTEDSPFADDSRVNL